MKTCLNCQKYFCSKQKRSKYCSRSCAATQNGRKFPHRKKTKKCFLCVALIFSNRKYCKQCYERTFLISNKRTIQDLKAKRKHQTNSQIREQARQKYRASDKPKHCIICGYSLHYEVCHIKAIKDYPLSTIISEVNNLNNLIALCPNHHWEFDNGKLLLPQLN